MTRYHSTIDVEEENNRVRKSQCHNQYIFRIFSTLYNTYLLLYFKGHNSDNK